jgi:hypothetical protein
MYLNIIKVIYKNIANIILNQEKLKAFPLKSGMRECPLATLFKIVLELLARSIGQEKNKWDINRKAKLFLFADDIILHLKDLRILLNLLNLIYIFSKAAECKNKHTKKVAFLYNNNEQAEKETGKTIPFTINLKKR